MPNHARRAFVAAAMMVLLLAACGPGPTVATGGPGSPTASAAAVSASPSATALAEDRKLVSKGKERTYHLYVPASLDRLRLAPLVLWLHGSGGNTRTAALNTQLGPQAEKQGFIVAFPQAVGRSAQWNAGLCCGEAQAEGVDDVVFISDLMDTLSAEFRLDPDRVYIGGNSMGGTMAKRLGCDLSARLAAIASVPGTSYVLDCRPARPISVMELHGTADTNMPYGGGKGPTSPNPEMDQPSVDSVHAGWLALNGCPAPVLETTGPLIKSSASPCRGGTEVVLYTARGGNHASPLGSASGGSYVTHDMPLMLKFFFSHKRSPAP